MSHLSALEKVLFAKHLSIMLKSGIPITEALQVLADQTKSKNFKKISLQLQAEVQNGSSLTKALTHFPNIFNKFFTSLVQIGEESGTLVESLTYLSVQLKKEYAFRKKS